MATVARKERVGKFHMKSLCDITTPSNVPHRLYYVTESVVTMTLECQMDLRATKVERKNWWLLHAKKLHMESLCYITPLNIPQHPVLCNLHAKKERERERESGENSHGTSMLHYSLKCSPPPVYCNFRVFWLSHACQMDLRAKDTWHAECFLVHQ